MSDNQTAALELLERELEVKRCDVEALERLIDQLRGRVNSSGTGTVVTAPTSFEFASLGVTEAIRKVMSEAPEKRWTTRDLTDALMDRGIRTRSKNLTASVYATLTNNKKEFTRVDGAWVLVTP